VSGPEDGVCLVNLDRAGVRRRARAGVAALVLGLSVGIWALVEGWSWQWRLAAVCALAFGALCVLQAMGKT